VLVGARGKHLDRIGKGSKNAFFRVGVKRFTLAFDGGHSAPYHITERRGKFGGSLWLGFEGLYWLLAEWASLRTCHDLKGFFRFYRFGYSILEFSCLQNQHGRFVELAEYHGGAQRGGIRVPEGYRGKGWVRFEQGLVNFFLGKLASVKSETGNLRNGKLIPNRKMLDSCDLPAKISHPAGILNSKDSVSLNLRPRVPLDPEAIRPTRKCDFKWNPNDKTLRITKLEVGKRHVEWVGLKYKAHGLIQLDNCAPPQAQGPLVGSKDFGCPEIPDMDTHSTDNHNALLQDPSSLSSSSDDEKSAPPASPRGGDLASWEAESPITSVWVDLALTVPVSRDMVLVGHPSLILISKWVVRRLER
jgi:hypothetical protein